MVHLEPRPPGMSIVCGWCMCWETTAFLCQQDFPLSLVIVVGKVVLIGILVSESWLSPFKSPLSLCMGVSIENEDIEGFLFLSSISLSLSLSVPLLLSMAELNIHYNNVCI